MVLIIFSLIMGYGGLNIGGIFGADIFIYLFGIVGILSPRLYVLRRIYRETKRKETNVQSFYNTYERIG